MTKPRRFVQKGEIQVGLVWSMWSMWSMYDDTDITCTRKMRLRSRTAHTQATQLSLYGIVCRMINRRAVLILAFAIYSIIPKTKKCKNVTLKTLLDKFGQDILTVQEKNFYMPCANLK